jgi:CRISPR-associated endonuclease/helicase Cas3
MKFYAHSLEGEPPERWQPLEEHLRNVAEMAAEFASSFGATSWGHCVGLLHDSGKASKQFLRRLAGESLKVDHSTFGARLAWDNGGRLGPLMSYVIAGHHGGLPDGGEQESQLHYRLNNDKVMSGIEALPGLGVSCDLTLPFKLSPELAGFSLSFFVRLLFSCLVDADFLDTERFCSPTKTLARRCDAPKENLPFLREKLGVHMEWLVRQSEETPVNLLRQEILAQCRNKATLSQRIFSLTVPTGGGKTLSSMTFALEHAIRHGLRRVIYAIPFTSIIEQNAKIFREIFGSEHILEHHCNYRERDEDGEEYNRWRTLAVENWDAPIVVTTNVMFFESLFSNKPSRCRKLHNIARSVIVLDEAQAIPTQYLEPCLAALRELVVHYGCSIVLCTATQPALDDKKLRTALPTIEEIIADPAGLYEKLHRTKVELVGRQPDAELAERLSVERQVLCIVSTKPQAKALFERLGAEDGVFHLSTNMYPIHRRRVLDLIRQRLKEGAICRVVSTSLVEAGVDLDFPVVFRAMAGLDSIAQAAGRCNREGKLVDKNGKLIMGRVVVFEPEKPPRMPWLTRCAGRAGEVLRNLPSKADPLALEAMRQYFELLYDVQELDAAQILRLLNPRPVSKELSFPFREAAQSFRFIEEENIGVIIPIEPEAEKLVSALRFSESPRAAIRKLQQYSVAVRQRELAALIEAGAIETIYDRFPILRNLAAYRDDIGLCVDDCVGWKVEELIQ